MTTLYRPVPITSAEQAEAMPIGTVATRADDQGVTDDAAIRCRGGWDDYHSPHSEPAHHVSMLGFTALVPIEAEERWQDGSKTVWNLGEGEATAADVDDYERRNGSRPLRRLVTPWEEA